MVEAMILKAQRRDVTGTRASKADRKLGMVPGIIYGHKQAPLAIRLSYHDFALELQHHHRLLKVQLDGKTDQFLIKEVQYDHLGDTIIHVDLSRVNLDERVTVAVAVELRGFPIGGDHGILDQVHGEVELECLVTSIPENIRVSAAEFQVGHTLTAADLDLPAGSKLISPPDTVLAVVHALAAAPEEETPETDDQEPELITERPKPEDQDKASES